MDKRLSQRQSGKLLAAAVASVGLAGFAASQSHGALVVDVRAISGGTITGTDKKTVVVASSGVTVTMGVFARISGTNANQITNDVNADGTDILRYNDDTLQALVGSFQSAGPRLGNFAPVAGPIATAGFSTPFSPYNASGQTNGTAQDWDSDGDLDIGVAGGGGTDPSPLFAARAASQLQAAIDDQTGGGGNVTTGYVTNTGAGYLTITGSSLINASTNEVRVGQLKFIVDGGTGTALINFLVRQLGDPAGAALWFEDGSATGTNPAIGSFSVAAPVAISVAPEPATVSLLGIAALGLMARRRKQA